VTPAPLPPAPLELPVLGYALRLAEPGALWLLAAVAAAAALGAFTLARRRAALRRAAGALGARVAPAAGTARPALRLALAALGLALVALALARPQLGARTEVGKRYGVDLVVALDASRSMLAEDVAPSRMARAKLEVAGLLGGLGGDRVAIVAFAGGAFVQCPLTTDHAAALLFLRAVEPEAMPRQGTSLAPALEAAREVLEGAERGARARVVLLVSDGEDHGDGAFEAAAALAGEGIRVFTAGVGTAEGAPVPGPGPGRTWKRDRQGRTVVSRLDGAALRELARRGDGEHLDLAAPAGLGPFREALGRMVKSEVDSTITTAWEERYAFAAGPGFALLLLALLLGEAGRPRREVPA
jgi:Ca-activated chloride channel family protein